jgi:uncharacterized protein YceH (UPF0502 family)
MASRRLRAPKPRNDVASKIAARLAQRVDAIKADRDSNAANVAAIQAAANVAQLRQEVVRLQRELTRTRAAVIDHDRLLGLALGLDDGAGGDAANT